jgi:hypothetical protein
MVRKPEVMQLKPTEKVPLPMLLKIQPVSVQFLSPVTMMQLRKIFSFGPSIKVAGRNISEEAEQDKRQKSIFTEFGKSLKLALGAAKGYILGPFFDVVKNTLFPLFNPIQDFLITIAQKSLIPLTQKILPELQDKLMNLANKILPSVSWAAEKAGNVLSKSWVLNTILVVSGFGLLGKIILPLVTKLKFLKLIFQGVGIEAAVAATKGAASRGFFTTVISELGLFFRWFKGLFSFKFFASALEGVTGFFTTIFRSVRMAFSSASLGVWTKTILSGFSTLISGLWKSLPGLFKGVFSSIGMLFKGQLFTAISSLLPRLLSVGRVLFGFLAGPAGLIVTTFLTAYSIGKYVDSLLGVSNKLGGSLSKQKWFQKLVGAKINEEETVASNQRGSQAKAERRRLGLGGYKEWEEKPTVTPIKSYKSGGVVDKTGLAYLHQGESVISNNFEVGAFSGVGKEMLVVLKDIRGFNRDTLYSLKDKPRTEINSLQSSILSNIFQLGVA